MKQVQFYILSAKRSLERFVCRLCEKVYLEGHGVYICLPNQSLLQTLDQALWTFRADSFVPHEPLAADQQTQALVPVYLSTGAPPASYLADKRDVLINCGSDVRGFYQHFGQVLEIVAPDERSQARENFKFYRHQGHALVTHDI